VNYAKRFSSILDSGDASPLTTLSARNKYHAMHALANFAKYTGRYDVWLQIRQRYNLRWTSGNESLQSFERFFNDELNYDSMLQRVKEMIAKTLYQWPKLSNSQYLLGSGLLKRSSLSGCSIRPRILRQTTTTQSVRCWSTLDFLVSFCGRQRKHIFHL
jgi:hypothetical protein